MNFAKWFDEINKITEEYESAFSHLSFDELNIKPAANVWSIGQIIDHVITTNETYMPIFQHLRDGNYPLPWTANFNLFVNFFGKFIYGSVEPTRKRKVKTFPVWEPSQSNIPADIIQKFKLHQESLIQLIKDNNDLIEKGLIISSPANRFIVYRLETAIDIIIAHERRHLNQAIELLERINN